MLHMLYQGASDYQTLVSSKYLCLLRQLNYLNITTIVKEAQELGDLGCFGNGVSLC